MVYNGILMKTIGISVMVSIGLLLFLAGWCFPIAFSYRECEFLFTECKTFISIT